MPEAGKPSHLRIVVADDHPVVREGLAAMIHRQQDMKVIAEASNGREAVEQFLLHRPDVSLIDLRMPVMDGIEAIAAIRKAEPTAKIVVFASQESEEEIYRALKAGAKGYALKQASASELVQCVRAVGEGGNWIPACIGAMLARRVAVRDLTAREMDVLRALAAGKSNKEIAEVLEIAEGTVKVHVGHLLEKLKVSGRTEATALALRMGLLSVDSLSA